MSSVYIEFTEEERKTVRDGLVTAKKTLQTRELIAPKAPDDARTIRRPIFLLDIATRSESRALRDQIVAAIDGLNVVGGFLQDHYRFDSNDTRLRPVLRAVEILCAKLGRKRRA